MNSEETTKQLFNSPPASSPLNAVRAVTDAAILNTFLTALAATNLEEEVVAHSKNSLASTHTSQENSGINLGQRFGKWRILSLKYHVHNSNEYQLLLRCDCGKIQPKPPIFITSARSTSCGCSE
jgi:hypothetical protein